MYTLSGYPCRYAAETRMIEIRRRVTQMGIQADRLQPEWCRQNSGQCYDSGDNPHDATSTTSPTTTTEEDGNNTETTTEDGGSNTETTTEEDGNNTETTTEDDGGSNTETTTTNVDVQPSSSSSTTEDDGGSQTTEDNGAKSLVLSLASGSAVFLMLLLL